MISLNDRRRNPLDVVCVEDPEIDDVDLSTVQFGDWIYGFGTMDDYAIIAFLHQCGRIGLKLTHIQVELLK